MARGSIAIIYILVALACGLALFVPDRADSPRAYAATLPAAGAAPGPLRAAAGVVVHDSVLSPGVVYRRVIGGNGKHSIHVVQIALHDDAGYRLALIKGQERYNGLESLVDMVARRDSLLNDTILAAVNANFWSAGLSTAIGPTVSEGIPIQIHSYKQWSSGFFDRKQRLYIDRFELSAAVKLAGGKRCSIVDVNRRADSLGLVLYNAFAGGTVPWVYPPDDASVLEANLANAANLQFDSTEYPLILEELRRELMAERRREKLEYRLLKVKLRYLSPPLINRDIPCEVIGRDTGAVKVPEGGALLSFGVDFPVHALPSFGDTVYLRFSSNVHDTVAFVNSVSGTPRLVRAGKAGHEARAEGATSRRFINNKLPRTAIGTNRQRDTLYLVSVDAGNRAAGTNGIDLDGLAEFMQKLGCYDAINLDGGSSTTMAIGGRNVVRMGGREYNRRISTAFGVVKETGPYDTLFRGLETNGVKRSFRHSLLRPWLLLHESYK